jgi:hypothetical protein
MQVRVILSTMRAWHRSDFLLSLSFILMRACNP